MIEARQMTAAEIAARDGNPSVFAQPPMIVENIAAHMIDIAAVNDGRCCDTDLLLRGFTANDLAHHGGEANRLAILKFFEAPN